ncbi:MAG: 50S ribosomal protein L18 [Nanoarchaeota archaeon]|nr:50S ribosomal protein L18 [Nanoarchaeota archaeon]
MKRKKFVQYRRKREGKTNYRKRLELLKSMKLRLVVRKSLRNVIVQIVEYNVDGDKTLVMVSSKELKKYGWSGYCRNTPSAYLVGLLCGVKAKEKKISEAILDLGLHPSRKGTILYSVLKGVIDSGVNIAHSPEIFPSEDRIMGKHISDKVPVEFEKVKNEIMKGEKK